ncbi:hypothetical protein KPH14_010645 [Odynerus spinipes]|uniref:Sm domain-containing protein n=1 Tax=Odynerus spinipes TaxID=1348599 RepID=A0AAD9VTP2_9HYME|nr:hypothetical protein KPH14_010645 [Odynerus spinipes]
MAEDESSSTSDESLDAKSEKFDPIKALYSTKLRLPSTSAPTYDNVCMFESRMKNPTRAKKSQTASNVTKTKQYSKQRFFSNQGSGETETTRTTTTTTRGRGRRFKEESNLLTKMPQILGPLGMLYSCMESRIRIKVYTRNARGIRGHVEAYVAAFDKHWNLALEDCFEVWTRKRKRKAPAALGSSLMEETRKREEDKGQEEERDPIVPKVVLKIEGKTETLERHVPQMLLRGEQVAIIIKIN